MTDAEPPESGETVKPITDAPLSVWLVVGLILGPAVMLVATGLFTGSEAWGPGLVMFVVGSLPATLIVFGDMGGAGCSLGCGGIVAGLALVATVLGLLNGVLALDALWKSLAVGGWGTALVILIWWPATRRWCGMLPPAELDDE